MPERQGSASSDAQYAALAAKSEAQFREVFGRLERVETSAGEARDIGKEVLTVLREQDALARIEQVRSELTGQVSALRQDTVHGLKTAREHLDAKVVEIDIRLEPIEEARQQGAGMASTVKIAFDILKFVVGGSIGALLMKMAQHGLQ